MRGAVTLYITITGVVFALLLAGLQESLDTHIAWVDFTVHKLMPVVLVADWLIDPPRHRLSFRIGLAWLLYPLAYLVYTLIRGARVDWYPYPFLDVSRHGYGGVLLSCAVMLVGFVAAAWAFVAAGNWRADRGRSAPEAGPVRAPSEQEPHLDRVPELAALAPELLDAAALLDEAELAIERDRGGVVGEDREAELVAAVLASRGDAPSRRAPCRRRARAIRA